MSEYDEAKMYEMQKKLEANKSSPHDEYAGQMREERVRTLLTEIDPENLLESLEYRLKGYKFDALKRAWVKRSGGEEEPELPEKLINKVISLLSSILTIGTTFSNLQVGDVNRIMSLLIDIVVSDLVVNGEDYGIKNNFNEKERICFIVFSTVYLTLRRAIDGSEAKRFFGSLRMNESIHPQRSKDKGMMNKVMDALQVYK